MQQGTIYLIINRVNGLKYVGQTTISLNKVWQAHIEFSKRMSSEPLHRAFRKFGVHNFIIREIEQCNTNLLNERQSYWIKEYDAENGYNHNNIEEEEVIEPVIIKEKKPSPFTLPENRGSGRDSGIRITGINLETGEIKEWENATDAAVEVTGNRSTNSNILRSARKGNVCYGYRWRLLENRTKYKPIKGLRKETWQEVHFKSINDAVRAFGCTDRSGIRKSLKSNGRYTWKGFIWYYL